MNTNFVRALLFAVLSVSCMTLVAHDDSDRDHSNDRHRRPRAADLADCCTPGDADFPKVGGNLGNQNYSALRQINKDRVQRLGAVWVNRIEGGLDHRHQPEHAGRGRRRDLHRIGVRQRRRRRWQDRRHQVEIHADARQPDPPRRRRRPRTRLHARPATTSSSRSTRTPARSSGSASTKASATSRRSRSSTTTARLFIGTNDGDRGAALALDATNGDKLWHFWGAPGPGEFGNDTWEGDSWQEGGATPWIHPAIDPDLGTGLLHVRQRARRLVAGRLDARRRQPVRQLDRRARPEDRRVQVALPVDPPRHLGHGQRDGAGAGRRADPRPRPQAGRLRQQVRDVLHPRSARRQRAAGHRRSARCRRSRGRRPRPRSRSRARAAGRRTASSISRSAPRFRAIRTAPCRTTSAAACTPRIGTCRILSIPGHGGGADWNHQSFSQSTGLVYTGFGYVAAAHSLTESSNGLRPPGEYQTGGIVAVDPSTNRVRWKKRMPYSLAHGNGILTTAIDLLFIGQPDGNLLALDAKDGDELWRFQTGAAISASPITYEIDGEQYIAIYAGGTGIPYGNSAPRGDSSVGVQGRRQVAAGRNPDAAGRPPSGLRRAGRRQRRRQHRRARAHVQRRRPTRSARPNRPASTRWRQRTCACRVGTTVTFTNPASNPNTHCATQFFEGLFNFRLAPGESATYTFSQAGRVLLQRLLQPAADRQGRGRATTVADPSRKSIRYNTQGTSHMSTRQ